MPGSALSCTGLWFWYSNPEKQKVPFWKGLAFNYEEEKHKKYKNKHQRIQLMLSGNGIATADFPSFGCALWKITSNSAPSGSSCHYRQWRSTREKKRGAPLQTGRADAQKYRPRWNLQQVAIFSFCKVHSATKIEVN